METARELMVTLTRRRRLLASSPCAPLHDATPDRPSIRPPHAHPGAGADSDRSSVATSPRHTSMQSADRTAAGPSTTRRGRRSWRDPSGLAVPTTRRTDTSPSQLTRLADVAVVRCEGRTVAVMRGFDRTSRLRAAELRRKLARRGVPVIDVTPLALSPRHRSGAHTALDADQIGLVVDAGSPGSPAPRHLAAELGVPLLERTAVPAVDDTTS